MTKTDYAGTPAFELSRREYFGVLAALSLSGVAAWSYAIAGAVGLVR